MAKTCLKCGYQRKITEQTPDYMCPACGVIYEKYEAKLARERADPTIKNQIDSVNKKADNFWIHFTKALDFVKPEYFIP
ncbi:MAG: hypothetical protein HOP23_14820 [Methylococcaceae bacterium]|nr:hypothetical protein [Methylococcaceae bacterium]